MIASEFRSQATPPKTVMSAAGRAISVLYHSLSWVTWVDKPAKIWGHLSEISVFRSSETTTFVNTCRRMGTNACENLRPPLPSGRGRARADSVSAWPYVSPDKERYLECKQRIHITGHSVWSTAIIRSSFIRPPYTSILERAVSISRRSAGVS
jgi:hypothetical protein